MQLQFFQVRVHASQADELNRFLATHRVTSIERQFVSDGANSFWSICVTYETGDPPQTPMKQKQQTDYRDVLTGTIWPRPHGVPLPENARVTKSARFWTICCQT